MKRALLVGIDSYDKFGDLAGCVNDVEAIAPLLARNEDGGVNFQCQTRTSHGEQARKLTMIILAPQSLATIKNGTGMTARTKWAKSGANRGRESALAMWPDESPNFALGSDERSLRIDAA